NWPPIPPRQLLPFRRYFRSVTDRRLLRAGFGGGAGVGGLGDFHLAGLFLASAHEVDLHFAADLRLGRHPLQVVVVLDGRAVEGHDDVVLGEAGRLRRAAGIYARDDGPFRIRPPHRLRQLRGHRLKRDADPAPLYPPAVDELRGDAFDHVGGDREPDALAGGDDGGVDPDDLATQVHERAARVARVDRGVGLDEVLVG